MSRRIEEQLALLDETVEYYTEDPSRRGVLVGTTLCVYKSEEGNMCAVGRCLDQDVMNYDLYNTGFDVSFLIKKLGQEVFKPQYRGFSTKLWKKLQAMHDSSFNWKNNKLTTCGESNIQYLKYGINRGKFLKYKNERYGKS